MDHEDFWNLVSATKPYHETPKNVAPPVSELPMPLFARSGKVNGEFGYEFSQLFYERFQDFIVLDIDKLSNILDQDFFGFRISPRNCKLSKLTVCGTVSTFASLLPPPSMFSHVLSTLFHE